MKPSAIKNELNAAIQFIKFAKRSRNMALTDPAMNATLDNISDILTTILEGTLRKINKDRNNKTTTNIQEGLPFTVEYVKRQTQDERLVETVGRI